MRLLERRVIRSIWSPIVVACAACGTTETTGLTPEPLPTPLSIVSGADIQDTVQVTLAAPLVIAVKTIDGKPRAGLSVRFDAVGSPDTSRSGEQMIGVAPPGGGAFAANDVETTDAQGRASARIQFGTISGAARVAITTADGMTDTARFTVNAGAAVAMTVAIHDTTVNFNDTFALGARLRDRLGNARADFPATSVATLIGTAATVSPDGVVHAGASLGRSCISLEGLGKTDSVFVNVVPAGTVAVADADGLGLRVTQTNGKLIRRMLTIVIVYHDAVRWPSWSPDGARIAATAGGVNNATSIQVFDTLANAKLLASASSRARYYGPQFTRDGQWLFFTEVDNATVPGTTRVYRMHPDGTGKEIVYFASSENGFWTSASPSTTGDFVILGGLSIQGQSTAPQVARLDVGQQRLVPFPTSGSDAVYSPTADRVAMVDTSGRIMLAQSNGEGVQTLTNAAVSATSFGALSSPSWSPDGAYLLARSASAGRYVVVRVSDGTMVPTAIPSSLVSPSWR
jgi:hypothetical protein